MRRFVAVLTLALAIGGAIAIAGNDQAQAKSSILDAFVSRYGVTSTKLNSCTTCDMGSTQSKSNLNAYGKALQGANLNFAAIESADSDGDGESNLAEIRAGTYPGSASDTLSASSTTTTSTTATSTVTTSTTSTTAASAASTTATTAGTAPAVKTAAPATPAPLSPEGTRYVAGEAGSVWLAIREGKLVVTEVASNPNWSIYSIETGSGEVEVEFRSGDSEVEFEAEFEDGTISVKVEQEDGDNDESDDGDRDRQDKDHDDERDQSGQDG